MRPGARAATEFAGVVVAAGLATRFGGSTPKQFLELGGRALVERAVSAIAAHPAVDRLVLVLSADRLDDPYVSRLRARHRGLAVVRGGATRADSVAAGLAAVEARFVLVHDAARPLASFAVVDRVVEATRRFGAAVPAIGVADTVKRVAPPTEPGGAMAVVETIDRSPLRLAQTPQGARLDWLRAALERARAEGAPVTDESSALERAGHRVAVVEGDVENRKITAAADLADARRRLTPAADGLRVGSGFDIHRVGEGRPLVLGGIGFPGEVGLTGHSDADVVLHAVMDALLGAAGLGDIGLLFPPDDPAWAGADSRDLACVVARRIDEAGFAVVNLDVTLLAERPKIAPRSVEMRDAIGRSLGIPSDRVGLKATTLERLGALGRGEGIACHAVALLVRRDER
ncbi:MAG TPA: 2-C-methyl-D-erythritol 4-phosphate cytidylyltransferase [Candidatus Polarisedimenticolaceae bacterium]|nr:2-C-methyl-D-erythritol 4-phosphate cytidylyltransferase [Candidatus Polarisedimenticolaceae bacterium]